MKMVSIVTPVYNAEAFLEQTIKTVQDQTHTNWEWLLIDDGSQDKSVAIIKRYQKKDGRIKLLHMDTNSRAALARNKGIQEATGTYLAFLDADDLWDKDKLTKQIHFIKEMGCTFSFTGYEFADADGIPNSKKVNVPTTLNYTQALRNTIIWTSTVMFDLRKITKSEIYMPNVRSEDMATWWSILRHGYVAYGLNEVLSYYRRSGTTLSSNKFHAIWRIWNLYRRIEKLTLPYSCYNFCGYAFNTVRKRL